MQLFCDSDDFLHKKYACRDSNAGPSLDCLLYTSDTTTYFDKESIKKEGHNIYSIETKSPADNGLEYRNIFVINGNTQKFNLSEVKLFDPKNQKVIKKKKYYDWYDIKSGSNISDLYQVILILTTPQAKTKDTVIHTTIEINPNICLLYTSRCV